jgi:hypothetical protein
MLLAHGLYAFEDLGGNFGGEALDQAVLVGDEATL